MAEAEIAAQSDAQAFVPGANENLWWAANCRLAMSVMFGRGPAASATSGQVMEVDDAATAAAPAPAGLVVPVE